MPQLRVLTYILRSAQQLKCDSIVSHCRVNKDGSDIKPVVVVKTITALKSVRKEFHCILGKDHKNCRINV